MPKDETVVFQEGPPSGLPDDARRARWYRLFLKVMEKPGVEALIYTWKDDSDWIKQNAMWQRKVLRDRASEYLPAGKWAIRSANDVGISRLYATYMGEADIAVVLPSTRGPDRKVQ